MTTAAARAFPNIALVKYWGKRDEDLILPVAGSLSLTLDAFATTTSVTLTDEGQDSFRLGGDEVAGEAADRVTRFLDHVRDLAGASAHAVVDSTNEAPTGAGLASSAAGFAALALAASTAYGLELDAPALSRLARRGSGSAARSIIPGIAQWHAGHDDASSFAEAVDAPDMRMVIVTVSTAQKAVSSREAMRRTAATSPYYPAWISSTEESLTQMVAACAAGDFTRIGEITESHALRMHAVIQACEPPIRYLAPQSIAIFDAVQALRGEGLEAYATADAGPNIAVIVRPEQAEALRDALAEFGPARLVGPGAGATLLGEAAPLDDTRGTFA
jgi:diphosphomevalonate decarboxylase